MIGVNHKFEPLEIKEQIARIAGGFSFELAKVPALLLSTCSRMEIYFAGTYAHPLKQEIVSCFKKKGIDLYTYSGINSFSHLCKVTAGLDSAVLGETEIQHQVKVAYTQASERKTFPKSFHFMFQKALRIGKLARHYLDSSSFNEVLWNIAKNHPLPLSKVLFVGYSHVNRSFARFLQRRDKLAFTLATSRPQEVVMGGVQIISHAEIERWKSFDWIIFATRKDQYLIGKEKGDGQLIFDLSVPRNVDPEIEGVSLWNMEKIGALIEKEKKEVAFSSHACEVFIDAYVKRLSELYRKKDQFLEKEIYDEAQSFCTL
jgi:glutamyl-tRNA reductase